MNKTRIVEEIEDGKVFLYPTDTVYGLGCDANNVDSVERIFEIKNRNRDKPVSVIAPSINWILENFYVDRKILEKYFPGPYTLLLKKKEKDFLSLVSNKSKVGIRIPDCEFTKFIEKSGVPFVTTSANISGNPTSSKMEEIDRKIINRVDIVIEGEGMTGKSSTIIDVESGEIVR